MELRAHQREDFERYKDEKIIPLMWECGVGKTITLIRIAYYKYQKGEIDSLLLIAPNGVHYQHFRDIPYYMPEGASYSLICFGGRRGATQFKPQAGNEWLCVVTVNVDTFSTPAKWKPIVEWANSRKTFIALDEASSIKNVKSKRTERILYEFNEIKRKGRVITSSVPKGPCRAVMTGTPVTNGSADVWPIYEFLQPGFFNMNHWTFNNYYGMHTVIHVQAGAGHTRDIQVLLNEDKWNAIKDTASYDMARYLFGVSEDTFNTVHAQEFYQGPYKHADELKAKIDPVTSFRRLDECNDMPEQTFIKRLLTMDTAVQNAYNDMKKHLITEYEGKTAEAANKITALIRLQQITSGFISTKTYEADEEGDLLPNEITWLGKTNAKLERLYADVEESAKPLIIITRFTAEASRIYDDLKNKYKTCLMTGWKREGTIEGFQNGAYEIMVANIKVVSKGFNLQNAHVMLFYSNTFSLEDRIQSEGRIWRMGQQEKCVYIDYEYDSTVDAVIVSALRNKRGLLDFIMDKPLERLIGD